MFDLWSHRLDFMILGTQKAGTTSLESCLGRHAQINCANEKEARFFNRDRVCSLAAGWHAGPSPFRRSPGVQLLEATPACLQYPFVAERILRFNPQVKLIILPRSPVSRALLAWNMFR